MMPLSLIGMLINFCCIRREATTVLFVPYSFQFFYCCLRTDKTILFWSGVMDIGQPKCELSLVSILVLQGLYVDHEFENTRQFYPF